MADWQAGLVVLGAAPLLWGLMYVGWRGRRKRQSAILAPLTAVPGATAHDNLMRPVDGVYVSTVRAGDWLDRIAVHGLGVRSPAALSAGTDGLWFDRQGAPGLFVPAVDIVEVRRDRGQAGKFTAEEGLVVVSWRLGEDLLDTAFRPRDWPDIAAVEAAIAALVPTSGTRDAA